jgi:ribosome-associated toxin RatA of RatAB toxin-antitoxin module
VKSIQDSIDVAVPVTTAYNQWTQFESFPAFMSGVERVHQISDTKTHWKTNVAGVQREFDAEITEQHPDERIAWRTVDGPHHAGVVTFHRLDDRRTRVTLQMEFEPEGLAEKAGAALGVVGYQAKSDLSRFKEFIEREGTPTGAWRGDVPRAPQAGSGETGAPQPSTTDPASRGTAGPASQGTTDSASQGGTSGPAGSQPPTGQPPLR